MNKTEHIWNKSSGIKPTNPLAFQNRQKPPSTFLTIKQKLKLMEQNNK